jgi:hypothetical protein
VKGIAGKQRSDPQIAAWFVGFGRDLHFWLEVFNSFACPPPISKFGKPV